MLNKRSLDQTMSSNLAYYKNNHFQKKKKNNHFPSLSLSFSICKMGDGRHCLSGVLRSNKQCQKIPSQSWVR